MWCSMVLRSVSGKQFDSVPTIKFNVLDAITVNYEALASCFLGTYGNLVCQTLLSSLPAC